MKFWLREPLVHFLLLGAGLFLLYQAIGAKEDAPEEIVVTAGTVEALARGFYGAWDRAPTKAELDQLIAEHTKEEIYYRAAVAAGLDRDDSIVRRRLRQKMEFLTAEPFVRAEATGAELERFIRQHSERYRAEDGSMLPAAEVRRRAARDWTAEREQRANDAFYEKLRQQYSVRIEPAPNALLQSERDGA